MEKVIFLQMEGKKAVVAMLISDKTDFKTRALTKEAQTKAHHNYITQN